MRAQAEIDVVEIERKLLVKAQSSNPFRIHGQEQPIEDHTSAGGWAVTGHIFQRPPQIMLQRARPRTVRRLTPFRQRIVRAGVELRTASQASDGVTMLFEGVGELFAQ